MDSIEYDFFVSQFTHIRDLKETQKTKISIVFYEGIQAPCILKECKGRDLSGVCQLLLEVRHTNIATVYDYLYANNNTYIIEEFIIGRTLQEILDEIGLFSETEVVRIMLDVCLGLEQFHSHIPPIVHNDIKTSNIMMREDGSIKLMDFDISRIVKEGANKNTRLFGTEEYASPEHYGFGQSEPSTDIYTLGVSMHEMLTGKGLTNERKMTYEGKLSRIIQKCIEVDKSKRYQDASELRVDLEKYLYKKTWKKYVFGIIGIVICFMLIMTIFFSKEKLFDIGNKSNVSTKGTEINNGTADSSDKESIEATEQGDVLNEEELYVEIGKWVTIEVPEHVPAGWKEAYAYYLNEYGNTEYGYSLDYIDQDEIPEMVIDCRNAAEGIQLCTYKDGNILMTFMGESLRYRRQENLICVSGGRMDYYYDTVYEIIDGIPTVVLRGEYGVFDIENTIYDDAGYFIYEYSLNDELVSEYEYYKYFDKFDFEEHKDVIVCPRNGYLYNVLDVLTHPLDITIITPYLNNNGYGSLLNQYVILFDGLEDDKLHFTITYNDVLIASASATIIDAKTAKFQNANSELTIGFEADYKKLRMDGFINTIDLTSDYFGIWD